MDASAHWQHFGHCTSTIIYWQSIGQILGNVPSLWTMAAPIHQVHFGQCMVASFFWPHLCMQRPSAIFWAMYGYKFHWPRFGQRTPALGYWQHVGQYKAAPTVRIGYILYYVWYDCK